MGWNDHVMGPGYEHLQEDEGMEGWPDDAKETMTKVAKIIGDAVNSAPCPSCATFRAKLDREKLELMLAECPDTPYMTIAEMTVIADAIIAYLKGA